jgi:hypothetical protein
VVSVVSTMLLTIVAAGYLILATIGMYYFAWRWFENKIRTDFGYFIAFLVIPVMVGWVLIPFVGLFAFWRDFIANSSTDGRKRQ